MVGFLFSPYHACSAGQDLCLQIYACCAPASCMPWRRGLMESCRGSVAAVRLAALRYLGGMLSCSKQQTSSGRSGNLGRLPETRKGIKLGGCLRKQGVGRFKPTHHVLVCLTREKGRRKKCRPPTPLGVSGRHFYMLPPAAARRDALNPKP